MRSIFFVLILILLGSSLIASEIKTIGLWSLSGIPDDLSFYKACGYNTFQICDGGFSISAKDARPYYAGGPKNIERAQKNGFKVYVILLSNVASYPDWPQKYVFDPEDKDKMAARLKQITTAVRALYNADGFVFIAGDPGGSVKDLGENGIGLWMRMAENARDIVKKEAPSSDFHVNLCAITAWQSNQISPFTDEYWDREIANEKTIIDNDDLINSECSIEIPMHNYYRTLTLKSYTDANKNPELYPLHKDIMKLYNRGVNNVWAWPYFIIDEIDDGYTGYSGIKTHPAQSETRYIHSIVSNARNIGINGMIGNTINTGAAPESLNLYAFVRFSKDKHSTPDKVIDEFSNILATRKTSQNLVQVLKFIENHSSWQSSMPEKYRLPDFKCSISSAKQAIEMLEKVELNKKNKFPMPEPASEYIKRLKDRLIDIDTTITNK